MGFLSFLHIIYKKVKLFYLPLNSALKNAQFDMSHFGLRPMVTEILQVVNTVRCPNVNLMENNLNFISHSLMIVIGLNLKF